MDKIMYFVAGILIAVMVLTLWVNIIVAVTKKVVAWDKFPVQVWVMVVAVASTVLASAALASYFKIDMLWYYWLASVVLGFIVCYAAMFGYDNLYKQVAETWKRMQEVLGTMGK